VFGFRSPSIHAEANIGNHPIVSPRGCASIPQLAGLRLTLGVDVVLDLLLDGQSADETECRLGGHGLLLFGWLACHVLLMFHGPHRPVPVGAEEPPSIIGDDQEDVANQEGSCHKHTD